MRKIKLILLTIGLIQSLTTFSEGCRQRITNINAVAIGLKNSDIVFLGDLIKADTEKLTYSFKILELYKGKYKSDTIYGKAESKYSMFPVDNGLWIVYAFFNKDSSIVIDLCGSTMPMKYAHYFGPPPPARIYSMDFKSDRILDNRISEIEEYNKGLRNWFYDLEKLRNYKNSLKIEVPKQGIDYKLIFLIASFIFNVLMFLIIVIKLKNN